ncbi:MAG: hypothetical protein BWZ09_02791 [Alphaproteobacteria bacterium ADurb.BinA305]|nr:MAG: hypothetical protein BWZ09_02791 [Alphaproteobacteria bacterium ADurb.BinA305]
MKTGEDFQRRCRALADVAGWAVLLLVLGIVAEVLWAAFVKRAVGEGGGDFRTTIHTIGVGLVSNLPAIFIALALDAVRRVFRRMGAGVVMDAANAKGLASCGHGLIEAAVAALLVTPTVLGWLDRGGGVNFDFEWTSVALLLLGVAFTLFADILRDAAAVRAELDEIV